MVLVRLAYVADLPVPADLVRALSAGEAVTPAAAPAAVLNRTAGVPPASAASPATSGRDARGPSRATAAPALAVAVVPAMAAPQPLPDAPPGAELAAMPQSFAEIVALFDARREAVIAAHLKANVRLVSFEPGRIEIRPTDAAPGNLTNQLGAFLGEWTGSRWIVAVSQAEGAPTLAEEEARRESVLRNEVAANPLVRAVLETFPGATIAAVRERFVAAEAGTEAPDGEPADDVGDADDVDEDGAGTGEDGS
jgi:DNA polymerase III subunit gamma/tau